MTLMTSRCAWSILLFCCCRSPLPAAVIYVNQFATGNNTGLSWADAYPDLQLALAAAQPGDEVWVAGGDYKPTMTNDRYATFSIPTGIAMYGGFAGTENTLEERDWNIYPTYLNGDIGIPGDHRDNSFTVVTVTDPGEKNVLDGFNIQHGAANDQDFGTPAYDPARIGGGLLVSTTAKDSDYQLIVRNIHFFNNYAEFGGGAYGDARDRNNIGITFANCTFELNQAGNGSAYMTGLGNTGPEGVRFTGCTFLGNTSINRGMISILTDTEQEGKVTISNCGFLENERDLIFIKNVALDHPLKVLIEGSTFRSNQSDNAGFNLLGISSSTLQLNLDSLTFRGNEGYGQLVALQKPDTVRIRGSIFVGNEANTLMEGKPRYFLAENCRISQNKLNGDAIRMEGKRVKLRDCILEDNTTVKLIALNEKKFGGLQEPEGGYCEMLNCTLRGNAAKTMIQMGGDSMRVESVWLEDSDPSGLGLIDLSARHGMVINSLFSRPAIMENKGALLNNASDSELDFINCTFYNYVDKGNGTLLFREQPREDGDTVQIRFSNAILWDELEAEYPLFSLQNAKVTLSHSILNAANCDTLFRAEPDYNGVLMPAALNCTSGNIFALDPQFTDVENGDFSLQPCSPAVNAGENILLPANVVTDLAGEDRFANGPVDLGAYEYQEELLTLQIDVEIQVASGESVPDGSISILQANGGTPEYNYRWSNGDTTSNIQGLIPGEYQLTLTDGIGCTDHFSFTVDFTSNVVDPAEVWGTRLSPNPARRDQPVQLQLSEDSDIRTLRLITPPGQVLWKRDWPGGQTQLPLSVPEVKGMYLLELIDGYGRRGYLKWMVQ